MVYVFSKLYIYVFIAITGLYLCWWAISPRGYHPPSSQYLGTDMVYVFSKLDIYVFVLLSLVYTSAGGLLVLEGIIRPVVSVSALTWFTCFLN